MASSLLVVAAFALAFVLVSPAAALPAAPKTAVLVPQSNDISCEFCTFAINELAKLIISNSTEEDIIKALDFLCNDLPAGDVQECTDFVQKFGPEIVQFIVQELNSTAICQFFGLCPAVMPASTSLSLPLLPASSLPSSARAPSIAALAAALSFPFTPRRDKIASGTDCDICIALITDLDQAINSSSVVTALEGLLSPLCGELGPFASLCVDFVNQFTPELLSYLSSEISPTGVCDFIDICPSEASAAALAYPVGSPCGKGPSYWCSSSLAAVRCHTIQYCNLQQKMAA